MSPRLPLATVKALARKRGDAGLLALVEAVKPKNKYGAEKTEYNGRTYDSATEARYAEYLDRLLSVGAIRGILPQVPLMLPGNVRYKCDFLVQNPLGLLIAYDVKGHTTETWRVKWRVARATYPWIVFRAVRYIDHDWVESDD